MKVITTKPRNALDSDQVIALSEVDSFMKKLPIVKRMNILGSVFAYSIPLGDNTIGKNLNIASNGTYMCIANTINSTIDVHQITKNTLIKLYTISGYETPVGFGRSMGFIDDDVLVVLASGGANNTNPRKNIFFQTH